MADISLSAAVRDSLLSLQNTTDLINRTQGRLSSGLRVSGAVDDPVAYFQSKSLSDRASDFTDKKEGIDQAVSTVSAALDGVSAVEAVVAQMKGIAQSMKSATGTQFTDLVSQFNDLRAQINHLTTDTTYQGVNLVNGTGVNLSVEFSKLTASVLNIASVDVTNASTGLNIGSLANYTGNFVVSHAAGTFGSSLTAGESISLTWQGAAKTYTAGDTIAFTYGTASLSVTVGTADVTLANGTTFSVQGAQSGTTATASMYVALGVADTGGVYISNAVGTVGTEFGAQGTSATAFEAEAITLTWEGHDRTYTSGATISYTLGTAALTITVGTADVTLAQGTSFTVTSITGTATTGINNFNFIAGSAGSLAVTVATTGAEVAAATATTVPGTETLIAGSGSNVAAATVAATYVGEGSTAEVNAIITNLDSALDTTRSQATKLGTNVSLLQTRLDFTTSYTNTLEEGSGKLTLADINQEGANLLALQTRQQLGVNSLAFAGQAEQSILSLFR